MCKFAMDLIPNDWKHIATFNWNFSKTLLKTFCYNNKWNRKVTLIMVIFFLSGINLSSFLPLNPAIYRIGNEPDILYLRCKEKHESHRHVTMQIVQINLNNIKLVSKPSQWERYLNWILVYIKNSTHTFGSIFQDYDKINKFSNFKCNIVWWGTSSNVLLLN